MSLTDPWFHVGEFDAAGAAAAAQAASQPLDTDLTAIAALVSAADKMPYATGAGTWSLADLSAFVRTILDDANAAAVRATIGAGTSSVTLPIAESDVTGLVTDLGNKQPLDATLTALAALIIAVDSLSIGTGADAFTQVTFAANTFPAKSSAGALAAKTLTDFALTILDDANAAAVRTTIGAGTSSVTLPIAESDVTNLTTDLAAKVVVGGQIGGTAASPTVLGIRETLGPTLLTCGTITDGEFLKRVGLTLVSATPSGAGDLALSKLAPAANVTITAGYSAYVSPYYEFVSAVTTEIGAGSTLEIG